MQTSLFEIPQLNEAHQPPLQQCSVSCCFFLIDFHRVKKYFEICLKKVCIIQKSL